MERRELLSLVVCLLVSLAVTLLVFFLLGWQNPAVGSVEASPPASSGPTQETTEVAVVVELPPGDKESTPTEQPASNSATSLATQQEGKSPPPRPESPPPFQPDSAPLPDDSVNDAMPETPPEQVAKAEPPASPPPIPAPPTPPTPPQPVTVTPPSPGDQSDERVALEGHTPPLHYAGKLAELQQQYPRIETAWVLDREPGGPDKPMVIAEVVLDTQQDVQWRNYRTDTTSDYFREATVRHILTERVLPEDLNSVRLRADAARFQQALAAAGLGDVPSARVSWGYYRHQAEVFEVSRALTAFHKAVQAKTLDFQPQRRDYLEIEWGLDGKGEPTVTKAWFRPEQGEAVELTVP